MEIGTRVSQVNTPGRKGYVVERVEPETHPTEYSRGYQYIVVWYKWDTRDLIADSLRRGDGTMSVRFGYSEQELLIIDGDSNE